MSEKKAKSCYLVNIDNGIKSVYLPHQKSIILGRCVETGIIDTSCSRQQVTLHADYSNYTVAIQQLGNRSCGFNGFKTIKENKYVGKHDDHLQMLYGRHTYRIEFNPKPLKVFMAKRIRDQDENEVTVESKIPKTEATNQGRRKMRPLGKPRYVQSTLKSPTETENSSKDKWESVESGAVLIYTTENVEPRSKIAAYDLDGTLIKTKSGLVFPKDRDDWLLLYPNVSDKLKELHNNGYKIAIFTNQSTIGTGKLKPTDFLHKLRNIAKKLDVPVQAYVSTEIYGLCRKPLIGMWTQLEKKNGAVQIDMDNSFFVGDAAGRIRITQIEHKKKDHSAVDRLLALNLGLKFETPQEHFLGHDPKPFELPFNPKQLSCSDVCPGSNITSTNQEIILMVGCPGSGKSHFVKNYLTNYAYVSRDTLGSWQKCVAELEKHLTEKSSVVIDNTNPDRTSRQRYIEVGKKYDVAIRCFIMSTSVDHAKHNNKFRLLTDPKHAKIKDVIIDTYVKNYEEPLLTEGFTELVHINFVPKFQNEEHKKLYEMYLLER